MTTPPSMRPPQRPVLPVFWLLAFALSWGVWLPTAAASQGLVAWPLPPTVSKLLGTFGPTLAALLVVGAYEGRAGIGALLKPGAIGGPLHG